MVPWGPLVPCPGVYPRGTPLGMPRRGTQGTMVHHPPPPRPAQEWASGLNRPRGLRVARGPEGHAALGFPYLRSFWPGVRNRLRAVLDNRWIGSRYPWAQGPGDVSDLECLS